MGEENAVFSSYIFLSDGGEDFVRLNELQEIPQQSDLRQINWFKPVGIEGQTYLAVRRDDTVSGDETLISLVALVNLPTHQEILSHLSMA
mgnify:CR=1 FL=1